MDLVYREKTGALSTSMKHCERYLIHCSDSECLKFYQPHKSKGKKKGGGAAPTFLCQS